jgi:hypothetical protein
MKHIFEIRKWRIYLTFYRVVDEKLGKIDVPFHISIGYGMFSNRLFTWGLFFSVAIHEKNKDEFDRLGWYFELPLKRLGSPMKIERWINR